MARRRDVHARRGCGRLLRFATAAATSGVANGEHNGDGNQHSDNGREDGRQYDRGLGDDSAGSLSGPSSRIRSRKTTNTTCLNTVITSVGVDALLSTEAWVCVLAFIHIATSSPVLPQLVTVPASADVRAILVDTVLFAAAVFNFTFVDICALATVGGPDVAGIVSTEALVSILASIFAVQELGADN